jgi:uncharacterized protein YqjF (DUF2071 family)
MLDIQEYLALRERPTGRAAMRQTWHDLTFLHYRIEPKIVQDTLPAGLTVDTFPDENGREWAWIGLVPFRMSDIRFEGTPAVPGCSAFPETNVRTYVHRDDREPGVWFYWLDASNAAACAYARKRFGLPYFPSRMTCQRKGNQVEYRSRRWRTEVALTGRMALGKPLPESKPGSLEFFVIERYLLYTRRGQRLATGRVFHPPYRLLGVESVDMDEGLVLAAGLEPRPWEHVVFSEGVGVEVFGLTVD